MNNEYNVRWLLVFKANNQCNVSFQVGKANGLTLLLDAETYEYSSHAAGAEGFKVAVDHHLDQPLMSISELDIAPGFESQGLSKFTACS